MANRADPAVKAGSGHEPSRDATLRSFTGYSMKRAFHAIQADLKEVLEPFGLRMLTFSALVVIVDNPGLRQAELADALVIERPNMVLIVDQLVAAGLISRAPAEGDRRAYALRPTEEGCALYQRATAAVRAHDDRMTKNLDEEKRQLLVSALGLIEAVQWEEDDNGERS